MGRYLKQPRVGDQIIWPRTGAVVTVLSVHDHGRRLVVQTPVHGVEYLERGERGSWTPAAYADRHHSGWDRARFTPPPPPPPRPKIHTMHGWTRTASRPARRRGQR